MIAYIDIWLDVWGEWSVSNSENNGYSSQTPIHKMMTTNAATTSKMKYRRQRQLIRIGNRYFERHIEPMRGKESIGKRVILTADNPIAEAMDKAIGQLREERLKEIIEVRYKPETKDPEQKLTNKILAHSMGMGVRAFEGRINLAHYCLDQYLVLQYPDLVENLSIQKEFDKSARSN